MTGLYPDGICQLWAFCGHPDMGIPNPSFPQHHCQIPPVRTLYEVKKEGILSNNYLKEDF
jgi:hypothetical protein